MSHISYEARRNAGQNDPIYIGFDEAPKKPKKPSNGFGAAATFFGVVGLLCTGVAVPTVLTFLRENYIIDPPVFPLQLAMMFGGVLIAALAMLCAFIGIFKRPRRYAVLGGLLALIPLAGVIGLDRHIDHLMDQIDSRRSVQIERQLTDEKIREASQKVVAFQKEHERWPDGLEGNRLVVQSKDSWNNELRYEMADQGFTIRSAGPDGQFETPDDCKSTTRISTVYTTAKAK